MEEKKLFMKEVLPGIILMDEAHEATGYLVLGEKRACVIDTMNGYNDLYQAARKWTDKPFIVVNTHGHPDHIFGNMFFDDAYMHPADRDLALSFICDPAYQAMLEERHASFPPFRDILPGDVIDLGGRTLEVFSLPGHTAGGILLLLREDRVLFTGDSINHHLWMQLDGCLPMKQFLKELDRVMFLEERADVILHGHAHDADDISLLRCMRNGVEEICMGMTDQDLPYQWFGGTDLQHPFRCDPEKHYQQEDHVICYRACNVDS
ncbi:MAG: MBL fold metallo-hydrolase [Selenomonadaceae bacterium]|nr:MBL fold metallo-hydrolase [Selenomonadaceae bacterium]